MTDRPSHSDARTVETLPHDPSGSGTTWIFVAAAVIGLLTVVLVGTTVAVTRSGPAEPSKASAPAASASPTTAEPTVAAAEGSTNIECDKTFIVELARSTTASADAGVEKAAADERGAKFLDAAASCSTYESEGIRRVAYLGPFDTLAAACDARVRAGDLTAVPRQMDANQVGPNYCICRKSAEGRPVLQAGAGSNGDVATLLAIGDLQRMLKALGFFKPKIVGDPYGPRTIEAVQAFQSDQGLFASGVVDQPTWTALRRGEDEKGNSFC
jgi:hypothetical protein